MKLVSYLNRSNQERSGLYIGGQIYDLSLNGSELGLALPSTILQLLEAGEKGMETARLVQEQFLMREPRELPRLFNYWLPCHIHLPVAMATRSDSTWRPHDATVACR